MAGLAAIAVVPPPLVWVAVEAAPVPPIAQPAATAKPAKVLAASVASELIPRKMVWELTVSTVRGAVPAAFRTCKAVVVLVEV